MPESVTEEARSPFSDRFNGPSPVPIDLSDLDLGAKPRVILDRVADLLGAEEHAILLLRRSVRTIRGHRSTCLHLVFMFSQPYADLLRATGWARFDGKLKCWYLPEEFIQRARKTPQLQWGDVRLRVRARVTDPDNFQYSV